MSTASAIRTFTIAPEGPFSLAEANAFGFGHRQPEIGAAMTMAFAADGDHQPVGVVLRQNEHDGPVEGEIHGDVAAAVVRAQVARVLSLDHDGREWQRVLASEPILRSVANRAPGLRPVLFHSPYEAAAWAVISARRQHTQGRIIRDRVAAELGTTFLLDGREVHAFPAPEALIEGLRPGNGLTDEHVRRLRGIAEAAADGDLEATELHRLGPEAATERALGLRGIGPFYAMLIVVRATGFADVLAPEEPKSLAAIGRAFDLGGPATVAQAAKLADRWRPFRTWATVTLRAAADRRLV